MMQVQEISASTQARLHELENEITKAYQCQNCARLKLLLTQNQQLCWALWSASHRTEVVSPHDLLL